MSARSCAYLNLRLFLSGRIGRGRRGEGPTGGCNHGEGMARSSTDHPSPLPSPPTPLPMPLGCLGRYCRVCAMNHGSETVGACTVAVDAFARQRRAASVRRRDARYPPSPPSYLSPTIASGRRLVGEDVDGQPGDNDASTSRVHDSGRMSTRP